MFVQIGRESDQNLTEIFNLRGVNDGQQVQYSYLYTTEHRLDASVKTDTLEISFDAAKYEIEAALRYGRIPNLATENLPHIAGQHKRYGHS